MHKDRKNYFISVEGVEGVGKSTAIAFLRDYLSQRNIPLVVTREPGGTPVAESIRRVLLEQHAEAICPYTELLLMFAGRAQNIQHVIRPALAAGQWVLSDRFTDASFAYQGGGRGLARSRLETLEAWVQGDFQPDLTLLFDAPTEVARARLEAAGNAPDRFEQEQQAFFERVRQAYLDRAAREPNRIIRIDSTRTINDIVKLLEEALSRVC